MAADESPVLDPVLVVGAGAMGCLLGARLVQAGAQVSLADIDEARLEAINREGIVLTDDDGKHVLPVRAGLADEMSGPFGLVLLLTKAMHSADAIASVGHLAADKPLALTLQNGLGNAELLARAFGDDRVLVGTAHVPADLSPPNGVATHGFGFVSIGGHTNAAQAFAPTVADLLDRAGFNAKVATDISVAVWEKAAFNAALNAIGMICQVANGGVANEAGRRIARAVVAETVSVAFAKGLSLDRQHIDETVEAALREHGHHKASMLQDRERGRPTEIESINGAIVREGEAYGVPTPVCATLADLVRVIERADD